MATLLKVLNYLADIKSAGGVALRTAGKEFEQLVLAIVRNLPLREPSVLTVKGLRRILQTSGGVSARIFRMLNEVAIEAIETGAERVTDEALERYKPVGEDEAVFQ
jgi:hypothetical protein